MKKITEEVYIYIYEQIRNIKFNDVGFSYDNSNNRVFTSLSFSLKSRDKVLIKGDNGSGKTTIIKILLGLYNQTEGEILVNEINLRDINLENLRDKIAIVSQNVFLFNGTILENILYGIENKKREDVEMFIKEFNLQEYIDRLDEGLDTKIVQSNTGISGGQAQIISFIRAMISEKDILILDEPISNVDSETREIVLSVLRNIDFDGILIIISHIIDEFDFINKIIEI